MFSFELVKSKPLVLSLESWILVFLNFYEEIFLFLFIVTHGLYNGNR